MNKRHKFLFVLVIALLDVFLVQIMFAFSEQIVEKLPLGASGNLDIEHINIRLAGFWIISALLFKLYERLYKGNLAIFYRFSWRVFLIYYILFSFYLTEKYGFHRIVYLQLVYLGLVNFSQVIFRVLILFAKGFYNKIQKNKDVIGIIGFNRTGIDLAQRFESDFLSVRFAGILDESNPIFLDDKEDKIRKINQLIQESRSKQISELYLCESPDIFHSIAGIFELAEKNCIRLKFVPHIDLPADEKIFGKHYDDQVMYSRWNQPLEKLSNRIMKRSFDIIFSLLVIIFILSWLYPLIGFLIKYQSPGPVLFIQKRSGMNNRVFFCLKFRSMRMNVESEQKMAIFQDPRVTPIGAFIRKTSIDELPQFFNVLMGDMSIVGPRPHMLSHTKHFNQVVDNFMVRHFIKPGITGLAQISGLRGEINLKEWQDRINFDLEYLENWSIFLDIKICFITFASVFKGDENAY